MERLSVQVASPLSGWELYNALSEFGPDFFPDDEEKYVVSVDLDHERTAVEVLATLQRFLDRRPGTSSSSVPVSLADRRHRLHGELKRA